MKRFALLVAALAFTASAFAAEDVEFKHSGEFRVRYMNDINATGQEASGQKADATGRFKLNLSARKGEKLQAFISLLHGNTFGAAASTVTGTTATTKVQPNDTLGVSRAWGLWKASDSLIFKVGRFGLEVADGSVLAENDYEAIPTAHEGLAAILDTSFAGFAFVALKTSELGALPADAVGAGAGQTGNPSSDPELNIYGVVADIKNMPEAVKVANVHVLQVNKDETGAAGSMNAQLVGVTVGGDVSNILYKVTAAMQMGTASKTATTDVKMAGSMYDLMVGYKMPEVMGLKITAGYHMDSGDESTTDDKMGTYWAPFYDKHNYAGLMDVVRWGNLTYMNVNASMNPMEDLEVGAGYYMFSRTNDKDTTTFGERYALTVGGTDKALGSELDLYGNKSYENGALKVGARFGMFMPGESLKNATVKHDKTLMQAMLQASLAF